MNKKILFTLLAAWISAVSFAQSFRKGPYLLFPGNNTSMTLMWQSDTGTSATLFWGTSTAYDHQANVASYGNDKQFRYTISGLTPGTKYYYKVRLGTHEKTGSFYTAPPSSATDVSFYVYGDTRSHPDVQNNVTGRILTEMANDPASQTLCVLTGDLVSHGRSEQDWDNQFFNSQYPNNETLKSRVPFVIARGNHENYNGSYSSGNATVFYKYWPYTFAGGSTDGDDMYYSFDYGPVHIAVLDQYDNHSWHPAQVSAAQRQWLQNDLAASSKPWKFVVLHEPGWSARSTTRSGSRGLFSEHSNNADVQNHIQPLCVQYDVQAVFGGHNHYYAHTLVDSVHHFTLGGGGAPLYQPSHTSGGIIVYAEATPHFMKVSIRGDSATLRVIRPDGSVVETVRLHSSITAVGEDLAAKVHIYPNPANGILHVQWGRKRRMQLELVDLTGRKVWSRRLTAGGTIINVAAFKRGLYILRMRSGSHVLSRKIILH